MATESRLTLNWSEIAAGAIAALSGAVTAMLLDVYGTLAGAGIMSAVTTVVATVSHHYLHRTRARLQQMRHEMRHDGTKVQVRGLRRWRPRRVKELVGGAALVGCTAVATLAAVQLFAETPVGQGFVRRASPTHARPVVMVDSDDQTRTGEGAAQRSSEDTVSGNGASSGPPASSGPAVPHEPKGITSPKERQPASEQKHTTAPDSEVGTSGASVDAADTSTAKTEPDPEPRTGASDAPSPAPEESSTDATSADEPGDSVVDSAGDSGGKPSGSSPEGAAEESSGDSSGETATDSAGDTSTQA